MKLLMLDLAGFGWELWRRHQRAAFWKTLEPRAVQTVFPALTCPVQASMRTGLHPEEHGQFLNGRFDRSLRKAQFWEQASNLFSGERIWERGRKNGRRVGQLCWQQSLGRDCDLVLTPQPIHKHHGGLIQDCYTAPKGMYPELRKRIGRPFNLMHYWGPFASSKSTRWISDAAIEVMKEPTWAPDLFLVYLPHMDYDQQAYGPEHPKVEKAFRFIEGEIERILSAAQANGYEAIVFGDYAITPADNVIYPNRILREAGLFDIRMIRKMVYPDLWRSDTFAVVDHQVAQIIIEDPAAAQKVQTIFESMPGIRRIYRPNSSAIGTHDLVLEADSGTWFAYPWWHPGEGFPGYATHMDIHNKPGFDPCELFTDLWPPLAITQDTSRIKGTHGNAEHPVMFGATCNHFANVGTLLDAAHLVRDIF